MKKLLKILLVVVLSFVLIPSVKAEIRTKCSYIVSNKTFDLIIKSSGDFSVQYGDNSFETVTSNENYKITNYNTNSCPVLTYKYEKANSIIIYVNSSNCSGSCQRVSPNSQDLIDYTPNTPADPVTQTKLDCTYNTAQNGKLSLNFINRNLTNYSLSSPGNNRVSISQNSSRRIYYDSCPETVNYYISPNSQTFCFAISGTAKCNEYDNFQNWISATLTLTTNYDENGNPRYEYHSGSDFYQDIDNSGSMTCEELLGEKGVKLLRGLFLLMKIAAPIIFIALSTLDFVGALTSDNPEAERNKAFRHMVIRAVACILLFMLPYLVKLIFAIVGVINTDTCGVW